MSMMLSNEETERVVTDVGGAGAEQHHTHLRAGAGLVMGRSARGLFLR